MYTQRAGQRSQRRTSRREREQARHRQEILDVALRLFSERGFHNVSMQEISQESEFGLGTIYKFFGNKEGLYRSMVLEKAAECHQALKSALTGPSNAIKRLESFVEAKFRFFKANTPFVRLYILETQGARFTLRAGLEDRVMDLYEDILACLTEVFATGIREKAFRANLSPRMLAAALDGMTNSVLVEWLEKGQKEHLAPDLLLDLFLGPILSEENSGHAGRDTDET